MSESICGRCKGPNVVWFAPNEIWNRVQPAEGILCPSCFIQSAEAAGIRPTGWRLAPEEESPVFSEAARIAAAEYQYWKDLDDPVDPTMRAMQIAAMGAAANICAAIALGKSAKQHVEDLANSGQSAANAFPAQEGEPPIPDKLVSPRIDRVELKAGVANLPAKFRELAQKANQAGLEGWRVEEVDYGLDRTKSVAEDSLFARVEITYEKALCLLGTIVTGSSTVTTPCSNCDGTGLVSGELSDEQRQRGIVSKTVACPRCAGGGSALAPGDSRAPKYWMRETSGVLAPIVEAYLKGQPLGPGQVAVMKMYLRQWIMSPVWRGDAELEQLRMSVERIRTRRDIDEWLVKALEEGHHPL